MRLRVCIPKVEPTVMDAPDVCPYPDCDGRYFNMHQQHCDKPLRDTSAARSTPCGGSVCVASVPIGSILRE